MRSGSYGIVFGYYNPMFLIFAASDFRLDKAPTISRIIIGDYHKIFNALGVAGLVVECQHARVCL